MKKGFTLIEVLVAMAISAIGLTFVTYFTIDISNFGVDLNSRLESERELEMTLRTLLSEIRSIGPGENGAFSISTATATTYTFFSDIDADGSFEQVRYFLQGSLIRKGVTDATATEPVTYPSANEVIQDVVHNVTSTSLFKYYGEGLPSIIGSLPDPTDVSKIRMVVIGATTDADITKSPSATSLSISATIRNLRGEI